MELAALQTIHDVVRGLGGEIVAISPQVQEQNAAVKAKQGLAYPVLSDAGNGYAGTLSIAFTLPDDLREVYQSFGIDLAVFNSDASWQLPLPTRIVVDAEGVILGINADPDYTIRPEPEASLELLRGQAVRTIDDP